MAVDYGAGASSAIAAQYADLRKALASQGEAENRRKAEDISRKGLFGTGITQEGLQGLANTGMAMAEFGDKRMQTQLNRAEKSFGRRVARDESRIKSLRERYKTAGPDRQRELLGEIEGIEMGMGERRTAFEDKMGEYGESGIWGSGFGSKGVGWRDPGESVFSKNLKRKERQAGILSDESRRQQGQLSDYRTPRSSGDAEAEAGGVGRVFDPEDPMAYAPGGGGGGGGEPPGGRRFDPEDPMAYAPGGIMNVGPGLKSLGIQLPENAQLTREAQIKRNRPGYVKRLMGFG